MLWKAISGIPKEKEWSCLRAGVPWMTEGCKARETKDVLGHCNICYTRDRKEYSHGREAYIWQSSQRFIPPPIVSGGIMV